MSPAATASTTPGAGDNLPAGASPAAVIHIGGPKTGSTYLQKRLKLNRDALRKQGVCLPVNKGFDKIAGNAKLLATLMMEAPSPRFLRSFPSDATDSLTPQRALSELLQQWRQETDTLVLSAEIFQSAHAVKLRRILSSHIHPRIVLFVRNQDSWFESYYNQFMKTGDISTTPEAFLTQVLAARTEHLFYPDWLEQYQAWSQAFGNCSVVHYEAAKSDLFTAFLDTAQIRITEPLADIKKTQASLHPFQIRLLYDADRGLHRWTPRQYRTLFRRDDAAVSAIVADRTRYTLLSDIQRNIITRRFECANERLWAKTGDAGKSPFDNDSHTQNTYLDFSAIPSLRRYQHYQAFCDNLIGDATLKASA